MWIAINILGNRIYCVKKTQAEVHQWLLKQFPMNQYREIYWEKQDSLPTFEPPEEWVDFTIKQTGMALPEEMLVHKVSSSNEEYLKRVISGKGHSFFNA